MMMKAYQRLEHIDQWSEDSFSKDAHGNSVSWRHENAIKFDMQGAVHATYGIEDIYAIYGLIYSQPEVVEQKSLAYYNRVWGWEGVYNFLKNLDI
jgi:hypothetical protein